MPAHGLYPACHRLGAYGCIRARLHSHAGTWLLCVAVMGLCNQRGDATAQDRGVRCVEIYQEHLRYIPISSR